MLDKAFDLVKRGGTIVYCICSIEPEEGEQQIANLLRRNPDVSRVPISAEEVGGQTDFVNALGELRTLQPYLPPTSRVSPVLMDFSPQDLCVSPDNWHA